MNKRALKKLMAENNLKSPDILAVTAFPDSNWDACLISGIFLDCTNYKLPFSFDDWQRKVKAPVELYFVFEHKKQLMTFLKRVRRETPLIKIIF